MTKKSKENSRFIKRWKEVVQTNEQEVHKNVCATSYCFAQVEVEIKSYCCWKPRTDKYETDVKKISGAQHFVAIKR